MRVDRRIKPDGRALLLYTRDTRDTAAGDAAGRADEANGGLAPMPPGETPRARAELRWHPLRGEWVVLAGHREERTFRPAAGANPLAPTSDPAHPTELPAGAWEMAVFENRFPALVDRPGDDGGRPPAEPRLDATAPARGVCEVVVYTQDPATPLGALPLERIVLLLDVWAHRAAELGARGTIDYVMPFENRGAEAGATLPHPHGQIYAYPFVPPVPAAELARQRAHLAATGRGLVEDVVAGEVADGRRVLHDDGTTVAFVPFFARYPYEVWIAPRAPRPALSDLDAAERTSFAVALRDVLLRYDGLWDRPMPYVMVLHAAPTDGRAHPEAHVHLEFYPALRSRERLKVLAGTELGAGTFTNDSLPETRAAELRAVAVAPAAAPPPAPAAR